MLPIPHNSTILVWPKTFGHAGLATGKVLISLRAAALGPLRADGVVIGFGPKVGVLRALR
jgi:hypothetical protein